MLIAEMPSHVATLVSFAFVVTPFHFAVEEIRPDVMNPGQMQPYAHFLLCSVTATWLCAIEPLYVNILHVCAVLL
jgi:hypothetical protein